jgi:hypothetical protein
MSEPRRLRDDTTDPIEAAMLQSVRGDAISDASRRRILAGLGVAGAIGTTAAAAGAQAAAMGTSAAAAGAQAAKAGGMASWIGAAGAAKWVAVSTVAALVPAAGLWAAHHRSAEPKVTVVAAPVIAAPPTLSEPAVDIEAPPPVDGTIGTPPRPAGAAPVAAAAASLTDEVAALQAARHALGAHDPAAALHALDRYAKRFGSGRLEPEATVLRIEALVQKGDRATAAALAERFETLHPKSPYAARIRSILGAP